MTREELELNIANGVIGLLVAFQIILIFLKLIGYVEFGWGWVLLPILAPLSGIALFLIVMILLAIFLDKGDYDGNL